MYTKPIWQSKTIWVNILAAVLVVLQQAGVIDQAPHIAGVTLDPEAQALIVTIANLVLRYVTKSSVTLTQSGTANQIHSAGGSVVGGNVQSRDFIGRDKVG